MFRHALVRGPYAVWAVCLGAALTVSGVTGCERRERVLDVQTPEGEVTVDRNIDTGEVEVNVDEND